MMLTPNAAMDKALQLTRSGQIMQATAMLQEMLSGSTKSEEAAKDASTFLNYADAVKKTGWQQADHSWILPPEFQMPRNFAKGSAKPAQTRREETAAEGGTFLSLQFRNEAGVRQYKLYVPTHPKAEGLPLIVMLHGCTQSADDFAAGTRMNRLAEKQGFLVAYPEQPASANASKCWNWFNLADQQAGKGEPALIAGITRHIIREYNADPRRVYIAGLSAGGAAAANMAAAYPDLYAAVGIHSGLASGAASNLPSALSAMKQGAAGRQPSKADSVVPTIVFHGDKDHTVHPSNGEHILTHVEKGEERVTERDQVPGGRRYSRTCYRDNAGKSRHEQWVIHGAGHAWSGGCPSGTYTDPKGVDASAEMVRFFLEQRLGV